MAEVGQRLVWFPGSWGRTVFKERTVRLTKVSPGQKGIPLWQGGPSEKHEVGSERKQVQQKEVLVRKEHPLLMQKTGPLGHEGEGVGPTRSSLSLHLRSFQESRGLCEWDQRQKGGRLQERELVESHQEATASYKLLSLKECLREIILNRWIRLEEGVLSTLEPCIPIHLHFYIYPVPNSNLISWPNPPQHRRNDLGRDWAHMALVGQHTPPHGTLASALGKCNLVPLLGQQPFSSITALICGARAYSTRNGGGRNGNSIKAPLFRSRTAYYDILGISGTATQAQIKTAYYRQSFRYHPDRNSGNEEVADRFSEVSEAYLILGNVTLRKKYDRGILSQEDVRAAGKPSSKGEGPGAAVPKRPRTTSSSRYSPSKPVFDFDEFYRAHYGEQLERERLLKWRREQLQRQREDIGEKWKLSKVSEFVTLVFISSALLVLLSFR